MSGRIVPDSPPGAILEAIRDRVLVPVVSWELADELLDVMSRPRIRAMGVGPDDLYDVMFFLAPSLPRVELDVELRDPDDAPVIAAAVSGGADVIVTGDKDLLEERDLLDWLSDRGITVLTPAELIERL